MQPTGRHAGPGRGEVSADDRDWAEEGAEVARALIQGRGRKVSAST